MSESQYYNRQLKKGIRKESINAIDCELNQDMEEIKEANDYINDKEETK